MSSDGRKYSCEPCQFIDNPKVDISIFGENNEIYQTITLGITFHGNG
jgi:hypothetical protein